MLLSHESGIWTPVRNVGSALSQISESGTASAVTLSVPTCAFLLLMSSTTTGYLCFEGDCANKPDRKSWTTQARLRQHQYKMHAGTREEETSMGRVLNLKREHDADVEEMRKRQLLEAEMACRTPEPEPPRPVRSITHPVDILFNTILCQLKHRYLSWTDRPMLSSPGR